MLCVVRWIAYVRSRTGRGIVRQLGRHGWSVQASALGRDAFPEYTDSTQNGIPISRRATAPSLVPASAAAWGPARRGAPHSGIIDAQPSDHRAQIRIDFAPTTCRSGLPTAVMSKTGTVPPHQGLGSDDPKRSFSGAHAAIAQDPLPTRHPRRYRTYFSGLLAPDEPKLIRSRCWTGTRNIFRCGSRRKRE